LISRRKIPADIRSVIQVRDLLHSLLILFPSSQHLLILSHIIIILMLPLSRTIMFHEKKCVNVPFEKKINSWKRSLITSSWKIL
jgi:hypothetical protein